MLKINRTFYSFFFFILILGLGSCSTHDLDPSLEQNKEASEAIKTSADIEGILKGAYNRITTSEYYGRDYIITNEVRTPNTWANGNSGRFTTEAGFAYNANSLYIWDNAYALIASANIIIGADIGMLEDNAENAAYAKHLQGQAYALRALAHFDLLKTFGQKHIGGTLGVPYISEFKGENEIPARASIQENQESIMNDIRTAYTMMSTDFFDANSKTFISKYAAKAFESRMAIWFERWEDARDAAKIVIDAQVYGIIDQSTFVSSFGVDNPSNSIFELAYDDTDNEGINGLEYIYRGTSYGDISVTPTVFYELYEDGDVRADILGTEVVGSNTRLRNMGKYPSRSSNIVLIRYEEVILNYAEALFELGDAQSLTWLNSIPENRGATLYTVVTQENILEERRKEFLFEGHYYWDLQRMGYDIVEVDAEQNINATIPYGDKRRIHPIPNAELDANSNMEPNP
ncbi:RagB/SusD family nutrient uptake outer membrane protein [Galbibacter sp.]|uniref:RagB/SusD family nutrient uptake outer membrane protein n=1 Tax=Galbibacter sp. TaxID=2918471 RepID=UPI003A8DE5E4